MGANEKHEAAYHGTIKQQTPKCGLQERHLPHEFVAGHGPEAHITNCEGWPAKATAEAGAPKDDDLSPVAKWVISIVALAIITPFVAILWAWAADVVRSFG